MSNSNRPKFGLCLFPISIFWLCLFQNPSYYEFFICHRVEFFMSISKGLIPNSTLCLIPKVLLQCLVFEPSMSNSKGLPTPIRPEVHSDVRQSVGDRLQMQWLQMQCRGNQNKRFSRLLKKLFVRPSLRWLV